MIAFSRFDTWLAVMEEVVVPHYMRERRSKMATKNVSSYPKYRVRLAGGKWYETFPELMADVEHKEKVVARVEILRPGGSKWVLLGEQGLVKERCNKGGYRKVAPHCKD